MCSLLAACPEASWPQRLLGSAGCGPSPAQEGLILLVCLWGPWLCAPQQWWLFSPAAKEEKIHGAGGKAAEYCRGVLSLQWTLNFCT